MLDCDASRRYTRRVSKVNRDKRMKTYDFTDKVYYEVGDKVEQAAYPGCPATVIKVDESGLTTMYHIEIDATGHPQAFDENGDPETVKFTFADQEAMEAYNK